MTCFDFILRLYVPLQTLRVRVLLCHGARVLRRTCEEEEVLSREDGRLRVLSSLHPDHDPLAIIMSLQIAVFPSG